MKFNKYYTYINTSNIKHYTLLFLTEEYVNIGKKYFEKYPTVNKDLFNSNKQAQIDYMEVSEKQTKIKREFFEKRELLCKHCKNPNKFIICSDFYEKFYVNRKYHYEQYTETIMKDILKDIRTIDKYSLK